MSRRTDAPVVRPEREEGIALEERPEVSTPRLFKVLLHNDDYTTMEFVVDVLIRFFDHNLFEATRIMLQVHYAGGGIAGRYGRDEAETRAERATTEARDHGFPLLLTVEAE